MIQTDIFFDSLISNGIDFFTGIPDSLLKSFCAYISDNVPSTNHIIAANEGGAIGLAVGYHLATGKIPLIYMQNSGVGNAVNPLLSIADPKVYSIPMILLIGWRGEPDVKDEPQHAKQGPVTTPLLDTMEIPFVHISGTTTDINSIIEKSVSAACKRSGPVAIVVSKGTFSEYCLKKSNSKNILLTREKAIETLVSNLPPAHHIISTTGMISRELYELREKFNSNHSSDFLNIGGMGHSSEIATAISLFCPDKKIVCLDGDGAVLMHMGALAINGTIGASNFIHIVLNNGAHDSVGGQPTVGHKVNLTQIAKACGYKYTCTAGNTTEIKEFINCIETQPGPLFLEIIVSKGARKDLGRPKEYPIQLKDKFMEKIHEAD